MFFLLLQDCLRALTIAQLLTSCVSLQAVQAGEEPFKEPGECPSARREQEQGSGTPAVASGTGRQRGLCRVYPERTSFDD